MVQIEWYYNSMELKFWCRLAVVTYLDPKYGIKIVDDYVTVLHVPSSVFDAFGRVEGRAFGGWRKWRYQRFQLEIVQQFLADIIHLRYCQLHKL